jgi:hypothetical protein
MLLQFCYYYILKKFWGTLPSVEEALILVERLQVQGEVLADILSMFLLWLWEGGGRYLRLSV